VRYDELARTYLLRIKLQGRAELLAPLGDQLAAAVRASGIAEGCDLVVPVPSHPWVRLRRGFNPAARLARSVAGSSGLRYGRSYLARRLHSVLPTKLLSARARRPAAETAFRSRQALPGRKVLIVDDVMTTGATLEACARLLKSRGAEEVRAAVWARAPRSGGVRKKSRNG